ncbi:MAG: undecaprenyl-diphosphate phosphatase, partial [Bacteroidales bacterium]|nr:undecaprenyl-diphosphate phosphatase [Bacteroidales bacterium]
MSWLQALLLGIVQGLTEFLPVSSSGHLMIIKELLGVDGEGFLDFTVTVHLATVLSTLVVFWKPICKLLAGFFKFKYNDETDYIFKILVSMIPVALVGFLFKDQVEALFGDTLTTVAICLLVTAALLFLSDVFGSRSPAGGTVSEERSESRNGINFWQAFVVGLGQACAVA